MPSHSPAWTIALALVLLAGPMLVTATSPAPHLWEKTDKLVHPSPFGAFGSDLALDGDMLVAGHAWWMCIFSPTVVPVYDRVPDGTWTLDQEFHAPENPHSDPDATFQPSKTDRCFGKGLAVDDDAGVLVIGDPMLDVDGDVFTHEQDAGAVYIYERAPNGTWELVADLYGPVNGDWNDLDDHPDRSSGPWFGYNVAVDGDTVLVGTRDAVVDGETRRGSVTVIERQPDGTWTRTNEFTSPNPQAKPGDHYGFSVDMAGDAFVVGSPLETSSSGTHSGAVHVYERAPDGWQHRGMLSPSWTAGTPNQVPPEDDRTRDAFGACIETVQDAQQEVWLPTSQKECMTDQGAFGFSVALSGDGGTLAVGSLLSTAAAGTRTPIGTGVNTGVAHVYTRAPSDPAGFAVQSILDNPEPRNGDHFSVVGVDEDGDTVVVGAPTAGADGDPGHTHSGLAWVFEQTPEGWQCADRLEPDQKSGFVFFGQSVGVSEDVIAVGGPMEKAGRVYTFDRAGPGPEGVIGQQSAPCGLIDDARWLTG